MVTVDAKGRVVLPTEVRERLGIKPGAEVEVREEDGRAVVEPEDDPKRIIDDLEGMIEDAAANRRQTPYDDLDARPKRHVDSIKRQADGSSENEYLGY